MVNSSSFDPSQSDLDNDAEADVEADDASSDNRKKTPVSYKISFVDYRFDFCYVFFFFFLDMCGNW